MEKVVNQDFFDMLPDALLLVIFNKVQDAKALCICMSLCSRFESLIPQTNSLRLTIPLPTTPSKAPTSLFGKLLFKLIPFRFFVPRCLSSEQDVSFLNPSTLLKSFGEIHYLVVELPSHDDDISSDMMNNGSMLKWNAEFGKEFQSCVILGATSCYKSGHEVSKHALDEKTNDAFKLSDSTNNLLKSRIAWAISCLIAASSRHRLIKDMASEHRLVRNIVVADGAKQGRVCMSESRVEELKTSCAKMDGVETFPALTMTMWYLPELKLRESECTMRGATLTIIRAVASETSTVDLAMRAFGGEEECFCEAVKTLISKKAVYTLQMDSF